MDPNRFKNKVETDAQLTKTLLLVDYEGAAAILESVNELVLQGKTVHQILSVLEIYKKI